MYRKIVFLCSLIVSFLCLSFQINKEKGDLKVSIHPVFGDSDLVLNDVKYISSKKDTLTISTLKFYLSNVVLEFEDGSFYQELKSVHLINAEAKESLQFDLKNISDKKIKKIKFDIGIDSLTNVSGDLEGDLDPALGMYWAWNSGYINMKLEGRSNSCKSVKKNFQFHIGGYLPKQNALQHVSLTIPEDSDQIRLKVDICNWLNEVSLKETNSIMIPGERAIQMSNYYKNMFQLNEKK